jgi:hypothetical protein
MRPSAAALSSQKEFRGIMKIHLASNFIIMQIKQPSNLIITLYSITIWEKSVSQAQTLSIPSNKKKGILIGKD